MKETIMNCNKILFMNDSKIAASGTHEQLLLMCKKYKELYEYELKNND